MKDLVIELILIAMIVVPLVADSLEPCRTTNRRSSVPRRTHSAHSPHLLRQAPGLPRLQSLVPKSLSPRLLGPLVP